jgi:hypothetical protein
VVLEEAYQVVLRDCPKCHGHGTRNSEVCKACRGTGFWHSTETRRKWMDTLLRAGEQRQRLLGLHVAQHDHRLLDEEGRPQSFSALLLSMPPEDLEEEIQNFLQASDEERAAVEHTAAVTGTGTPRGASTQRGGASGDEASPAQPPTEETDVSFFDDPPV